MFQAGKMRGRPNGRGKWEEQIRNGGRLAALSLGRETDTPTPYLRT